MAIGNHHVLQTLSFSPLNVPGLALWFKASDLLNGGALPSNGTAVSVWKDKSGNGRDATQATGANQPAFQTSGFNGKPCVLFSGSQWLTTAAINLSQPATIFLASNWASWTSGVIQYTMDGVSNRWLINTGNPSSATALDIYAGGPSSLNSVVSTNALASPCITAFQLNGASSFSRLNGFQIGSGNPGTSSIDTLSFGDRAGLTNGGLIGPIAELLIYLSPLNANQIVQVESYLGDQYKILVNTIPANNNLSNWLFNKPVTIDNTGNASILSNYQIKVALTSSNFDFSKPQASGNDVRFIDSDGVTFLNYWQESYDNVGQTATFWVNVPTIPGSSTKTIHIYYGNAAANNVGNGDQTFDFFDDFANPVWQILSNLPVPRADATAAVMNGKFYLIGGYNNTATDVRGEMYTYDPSTQNYTQLASMTPRWGAIAAPFNGKIYVFGGQGTSAPATNNEVYDPTSNTWATKTSVPTAIGNEGITGCAGNSLIYLFYYSNAYSYDPVGDSYTQLTNVPNPVSWGTCVNYGGNIYLIGGYSSGANQGMGYVQIYNITNNTWSAGTTSPFGFYGAIRENPLIGDNVYIVQGQRVGGEFSSKVYVYNITADTWTEKAFGPHAADGVVGGIVNGLIYSFGGRQDGSGPFGLSYASVYNPSLDTSAQKWTQIAGGFEMRAGVLTSNSNGTTNSYQLRSTSYQTTGDFIIETSETLQNSSGFSSTYINGTTGTYDISGFNSYLLPYNDFGVSPATATIYKETGTSFSSLNSVQSLTTGTNRYKTVSTAANISLYKNNSLFLSTNDTTYRNGFIGFITTKGAGVSWDFVFIRKYTSTEPAITVGP